MPDAVAGPTEDDLSDDERRVLWHGLAEWGGPARPTEQLVIAMGFRDLSHFAAERRRLRAALDERQPLTAQDWQRVLVATEFVFVSDRFGSGVDWPTTTGLEDAHTITLLRSIQRKMGRWRSADYGG